MSTARETPAELERMHAAVRASGIGVWLNRLPLGELTWDENVKRHFHLPPEAQPTIELFYERLHEEDRERVRQAIDRAVQRRESFDQVYRTVGPQGQLKWIRSEGRVLRDEGGQASHFDGTTVDITAQVLAQQRLHEFADAAPAMLWVTEPNGECSFLSRGWTVFTGQDEAAGLGFGWLEMVHPDDRAHADAAFRAANERQVSFVLEHRVKRIDGSWHWVLDAGRPRLGPGGGFLGFVGSVTDIHDRRMAEDALRRSSERYVRLLDSIDQGFCVVEVLLDDARCPRDYRFVETNGVFERQTGLAHPRGKTARELVPDLEEFWVQTYGQVALTGRARRFIHGSPAMGRWFDVYASPIGEPGELQVAILFQDITQHRLAEARLRESEERYRAFLANSSEGIWRMEFDPPVDTRLPPEQQLQAVVANGRFAECNEAFARMYGLKSSADVMGRGLEMAMDVHGPQAHAYLISLVESGYRASEVESQEFDQQGRTLWFANNLSGVIEDGLLLRAWGTQRDITDRKRAEEALVEADRRKDEFLATLAHELRNPLAPIRSAAELLRLRGVQDPQLLRPAEIIARQVGHLARMIDDLMDVSRITRGKLELRLAPLVLQNVVRAAAENASDVLRAGNHPLELVLPDEPIELVGDDVRLVQILLNLLANAARYSAEGRPVRLTVAREVGQAVVRVHDQGIGIAPDQLPRVFDLFYQGASESERATGGLGIGLSLVQRLAELHGGSVEAHSAGPGQGSEFLVRLPLHASAAPAPAPRPEVTGAESAGARRVLIVDDNRDGADTLAEMLRLMGYEADTAYDGVEGVARAEALRPEVLVLDLGMPRLDGYGACRAVRASEWGRDMAVIALSGWGQAADKERAAQAGFDSHLVKPIAPDSLVRCIDEVVAARRAPH
jgi:PAS domain S-box-containing protein